MIVFKTFLKVLNKCKAPIIMYTVFLVLFGGFYMQTSDNSTNFVASKPDVLIINKDVEEGLTKNFISYIDKNCNIKQIDDKGDAIDDALFYRDVNYIIYIPSNFREDFLNKKNPTIEIKSTGDYQSSLAELLLKRYMKIANFYNEVIDNEEELIYNINDTLSSNVEVEITSKLDTNTLSRATFYFNFTNYCILAGCIYVICLVLSSFKNNNIKKRTVVSSMNYKKYNHQLLISNSLFAITLWFFYILLSFILLGNIMFSWHGLIYIINSFIFTLCALTVAFLIGSLVSNKNAINGIVNVVALGSSFLCGAFVQMEYLPDSVLDLAHILPSYWYIKTNEMVKTLEVFDIQSILPILINMSVVVGFAILFVVLNNIISKRKRKLY